MFVTENEAAELRCPMGVSNNTITPRCKASDCMAWRWSGGHKIVEEGPSYEFMYSRSTERRTGYCGLASYPTVSHG